MRNTIITVNASSFSENFPFYGQIPSPGDEVVVSVTGGGGGETDKRETFLLPFSVLKVAIRISKGTGSSVPCIKSRVSSTVLSLSAVNGLMPSSVVLCRPRSFNSESFE